MQHTEMRSNNTTAVLLRRLKGVLQLGIAVIVSLGGLVPLDCATTVRE